MQNPKVKEAIEKGREAHEALKQKVKAKAAKNPNWKAERPRKDDITGKTVIPDVQTPSGRFIELKPNTVSGRKQGARQKKKYEQALGKKGKVVYYDPNQ